MASKQRIIRTLRVRNQQHVGVLSKVIQAIANGGGDIGDIRTLAIGTFHTLRDITVTCDTEERLAKIVEAVRSVKESILEEVVDEVMELHRGGKLTLQPRFPVKSIEDLQKVYTPGVAGISKMIHADPGVAYEFTSIGRSVAIVTNGTRVLGLGNIGPVAAMPVMEGKAALFAQFSGLNMLPILLKTEDPKEFVDHVVAISPGFAAIQLEDIRTPDCYWIEEELIRRLPIPVMHDDQHGTAVVALAAVINACRIVGRGLNNSTIGQIGLGAAGSSISRLIMKQIGRPVLGTDPKEASQKRFRGFGGELVSSVEEVMRRSDVVVATSGQAGLIEPRMVRKGQVILALSNPEPEISVKEATEAGAGFASDGRRVNNLLGYPGILKGAVTARAKKITLEMYLAAVDAIVRHTPERELVPDPLDPTLHDRVAKAVAAASRTS